ncbi:MAG: hypothetical protein LBE34_09190 [Flavobacteriaceae bacterium]|jgi:hypothetical protein|nr:hypothetical protein [Flavobacteriaceae bacterium]
MKDFLQIRIVTLVLLLLNVIGYAQNIGVDVTLPTEKLDIGGKVRMRNVNELEGNSFRKAYATDSDGSITYKTEKSIDVQMYSARLETTTLIKDGVTAYNKVNDVLMPLNIQDTKINNLGIEQGGVNMLKIKYDGYYMYSGYFNLYLSTNNNESESSSVMGPYFSLKIEVSSDNGKTWRFVTGADHGQLILNPAGDGVLMRLPSIVVSNKAGDLIRAVMKRTIDNSTPPQPFGAYLTKDLSLSTFSELSPYMILITKK